MLNRYNFKTRFPHQVDFDKTKHLAETTIKKREEERDRLRKKEMEKEDAERKKKELEELKRTEEL
jgi:hypothetical protein